jgi:hypothetical protein
MSPYAKACRDFQRQYWQDLIKQCGSVRNAALAAGYNRTGVYTLLKKIGLRHKNARYYGNWGDLADRKGRDL